MFTINRGNHREKVIPSEDNPLDVESLDQLILMDKEKGEQHIRLDPRMSAEKLRKQIEKRALSPTGDIYLRCDESAMSHYRALLKEVYPNGSLTEGESTDAGVHRIQGRTYFTVSNDYWRAIAKIGFHYYLVNSRRGTRGDEPEFANIRRFITEGGDPRPFFSHKSGARFNVPFGVVNENAAILPSNWMHLLAADETQETAVAMVTLFVGPERPAPQWHIHLGRFQTLLMIPGGRSARAYVYNDEPSKGPYAGRVLEGSTIRLR